MDLTPGPVMRFLARRLDAGSPGGLHLTVGLGGAFLFLLAFLSIAEDLVESASSVIDRALHTALAAAASPVLTRVFWAGTLTGDTRTAVIETAAAVSLLLLWGRPRRAAFLAGIMIAGSAAAGALKDVFDRARPPASAALVATPESFSFPSGHTIAALLFFGSLALMLVVSSRPVGLKVLGVIGAVLATLLVGLSRVYLGVHWFSDVVASWCLGAALLCAGGTALLAWERFGPPPPMPRYSGRAAAWRWALTVAIAGGTVWALVTEAVRNPLV